MPYITSKIIALIFLLILSAFFSCSETAFFSLTRAQMSKIKNSKKGYGKMVMTLWKNPREALITILFGNELVNVAFAIVVAWLIHEIFSEVDWRLETVISVAVAVPIVLIFGEVVPKNVAIRFAPMLVSVLVYPLRLFAIIVFPFRFVLTKFADSIVRLFGGDPEKMRSGIMEREFRQLVDLGFKEGALEEGESELIHRIFELGNRTVSEIMTNVGEIFRLPLDMPLERIVQEIKDTQYSRVPVYVNEPDEIIGALHARDLFKLIRDHQRGRMQSLENIIRPVHFVDEHMTIEKLMTDMQKLKTHIAIVKNKDNEVEGLVTMDDIFRLLFTQKLEWRLKK